VRERGVLQAELGARQRDFFLTSWGNASLDPVDLLNPTLRTDGPGNYTGYSSPQTDALLAQAMIELDPERRARLYAECARLIHTDAPWVFLFTMKELYGARVQLSGWRPSRDGWLSMHDAALDF
jgi:peptide/nickel transport system substrate-binding protein